jgi:uncharacterized protein YqeY
MSKRIARSAEARKVLRELNAELTSTSVRTGQQLLWSADEAQILELIASTIDRKCDLTGDYEQADTPALRVKLSGELRLLENSLARLLKQVQTEVPAPMSSVSRKAQKAANTRWDRERARAANGG